MREEQNSKAELMPSSRTAASWHAKSWRGHCARQSQSEGRRKHEVASHRDSAATPRCLGSGGHLRTGTASGCLMLPRRSCHATVVCFGRQDTASSVSDLLSVRLKGQQVNHDKPDRISAKASTLRRILLPRFQRGRSVESSSQANFRPWRTISIIHTAVPTRS